MIDTNISAWLLYAAFIAFTTATLLTMIGMAFCVFLWTANKFICTYTCVRAVQEAYRQGLDPLWPFWRTKAREMKAREMKEPQE